MNLITPDQLKTFFTILGARANQPAELYLFGGSAVVLIGGPRHTADIDFTCRAPNLAEWQALIQIVAAELGLDAEESAPAEFLPLPADAEQRHQFIGQYGSLRVYIFDPYSLAVMKIDRAFESDIEDVRYLLQAGTLELTQLATCIEDVAQRYDEPRKLRQNFALLKRSLSA